MRKTFRIAVLILLLIAVGVSVAASILTQPERVKAWIAASVFRATGRTLAIKGRLDLSLSFTPTIVAEDVELENIKGGTRPDMARIERIEAQIFLPALLWHRIQVPVLRMKGPNILFEQANGKPNWLLDAPKDPDQPKAPAIRAAIEKKASAPYAIDVRSVWIKDGLINWNLPGNRDNLGVRALDWRLSDRLDALDIHGVLIRADHPISYALHAVPQGNDLAPWKVQSKFGIADAVFEDSGTASLGGQYDLQLKAHVPQLEALQPWLPEFALPPLHDLSASAAVINNKAFTDPPVIKQLTFHTSGALLDHWAPGWRLGVMDVALPQLGQPASITGEAWWADKQIPFAGSVQVPARPTATSPVMVDLHGFAPGVPLHDVSLRGRFAFDPAKQAVSLAGLHLAAKEMDLTTDGSVTFNTIPKVEARIHAPRIDADALLALVPKTTSKTNWTDEPLPWSALKKADIGVTGQIETLTFLQHVWKDVGLTIDQDAGQLRKAAITTHEGGSNLSAALAADAASHNASLTIDAPAIPLPLMTELAGLKGHAEGEMRFSAKLRANGVTPHAMKKSLGGTIDAHLQSGKIATKDFVSVAGPAMQALSIPKPKTTETQIACIGMAGTFVNGEGRLRDIAFDTSSLKLAGEGLIDFNSDTIAFKLHPVAMLAGSMVTVPVLLKGPISNPAAELDADGFDQAGLMLDALFGGDTPHICKGNGFAPMPPQPQLPAPVSLPGRVPAPPVKGNHGPVASGPR